jgi:hypothetical protein
MAKMLGGSSVGAVRSLRRALHKMVKDGTLITMGKGRPGKPYRYYFEPTFLAIVLSGDKAKFDEMSRWDAERPAHVGKLLLEARSQMADKEFFDWIKAKFKMTPEQAEQYIDAAHQKEAAPSA